MSEVEAMEANGTQLMPDFDETTDHDDEAELVDAGVKVRRSLKDEFQDNVRGDNDGRIRGVYRGEMENSMTLRNYLFDKGIEPHQAIERLEVYENLMPIEAELNKISETVELTADLKDEISSLNRNVEQIRYDIISQQNEKFNQQNSLLEEIEDETDDHSEELISQLNSLNENLEQMQSEIIAQQDEMFRQQNSRLDRLEYTVSEALEPDEDSESDDGSDSETADDTDAGDE